MAHLWDFKSVADLCACRLLSTFQKELEEITIIAMPEETEGEGQGRQTKAVQLHSFIDPAKGLRSQSASSLYADLDSTSSQAYYS